MIKPIMVRVFDFNGDTVDAEVRLTPTEPKKVADVTLHFTGGFLSDMKLTGFSVWRRFDNQWSVSFPQQTWRDRGERKRYSFLRPQQEGREGQTGWQTIEQDVVLAVKTAQQRLEMGDVDELEGNV